MVKYGEMVGKITIPATMGGALGIISGWEESSTENYATHEVAGALRAYIQNTWNEEGYKAFLRNHPDDRNFIYALKSVLNEKMERFRQKLEEERLQPRLFP